MKKISVTFSIPEELNTQLHSVVEKRGLSAFVSNAIEQALEKEQHNLENAYKESNSDSNRVKLIEEWSQLDGEDWND